MEPIVSDRMNGRRESAWGQERRIETVGDEADLPAAKAAEENFMETDVRLRLLLQNNGSLNES